MINNNFFKKWHSAVPLILFSLFLIVVVMVNAQSAGRASIIFTKDKISDTLAITFKDSDGIRTFSIIGASRPQPYSGDFSNCPRTRIIDNVSYFRDPVDFTPMMTV